MEDVKSVPEQQPEKNAASEYDHMGPGLWFLRVIQGALIGAGAILPGISGGVLCVLFGIYRPMMGLLSHPFKMFKTYYKLFIPVLIGWFCGFIGLAKLVELLLEFSEPIAICLFFGLIVGTIPSVYREAGTYGHGKKSIFAMCLCFAVLFTVLYLLSSGTKFATIEANTGWFFFCGIVWGLSLVIPGLSSSSILIAMGLYEQMNAGIAEIRFGVILPVIIGVLVTALSCARFVNDLFEKHHSVAYHSILGIVAASTLVILLPLRFVGAWEVIVSIVCAVVGFFAAWGMDKYGEKVRPKD